MTEAFDALQLIVVSLKVDMLQAFNISVDYVDADGDWKSRADSKDCLNNGFPY